MWTFVVISITFGLKIFNGCFGALEPLCISMGAQSPLRCALRSFLLRAGGNDKFTGSALASGGVTT